MILLTTNGMSLGIEKLIKEAQKELWLISPYLKIHDRLIALLQSADDRDVNIHLIYGKKSDIGGEMKKLKGLLNLSIYFCKNLHAKAYFNEEEAIIGSMNLYEYSAINNVELGVLLESRKERQARKELFEEVKNILKLSVVKKNGIQNEHLDETEMDYIDCENQYYELLKPSLLSLNFKKGNNSKKFYTGRIAHNVPCSINNEYGLISFVFDSKGQFPTQRKISEIERLIGDYRVFEHTDSNRFCIYPPQKAKINIKNLYRNLKVSRSIIRFLIDNC